MRPDKCPECGEMRTTLTVESYRDDCFVRNRVIVLHGLSVEICGCGDAPVYPCLGPLCELVQSHPSTSDFHWNDVTRRWCVEPVLT